MDNIHYACLNDARAVLKLHVRVESRFKELTASYGLRFGFPIHLGKAWEIIQKFGSTSLCPSLFPSFQGSSFRTCAKGQSHSNSSDLQSLLPLT